MSGERVRAFVPNPLPLELPVAFTATELELLERANRALGRLDGLSASLPEPSIFLNNYLRKEALLSAQIEGTQSSMSDLLLFEMDEPTSAPREDAGEVANYVAAMRHGLSRLRDEGFPLSLRLIREIHEILLRTGRGSNQTPGEFRRTQNWVGGTRPGNALFVPPPPDQVAPCMGELETFLTSGTQTMSHLLKAALAHVQFETIHPFLDGNGRLGRLLITFVLCADKVLQEPLLYLSLHFKTHRDEYYEALQRVRTDGDWKRWILFFLEAVAQTSRQATETARRILKQFETDRDRIASLGRRANSALRVHDYLKGKPYLRIQPAASELGLSSPTVRSAAEALEGLGILREITTRRRDRIYRYNAYMTILEEGTEPLPL
jgi:Fic family protein